MDLLISTTEPDAIVVTYVEGKRLIDLIKNQADGLDMHQVSYHYGEEVETFFEWSMPSSASDVCNGTIRSVIEAVRSAIDEDKRYKVPSAKAGLSR